MSPVEYIQSKYQAKYPANKLEEWRAVVGTYGIPKEYHLEKIKTLSDGLKTRLVFCEISLQRPHLLLLDEPTNAADMEMIDSMAEAIKAFNGGVVVISHDFRLLSQVAEVGMTCSKFYTSGISCSAYLLVLILFYLTNDGATKFFFTLFISMEILIRKFGLLIGA
jgi:ATPase subunit of ABC transporter with duplicated ATPase domains